MPDIPPEAYEHDCFHPPSIPTEVCCLHCQRTYDSYLIEWRETVCRDGTKRGFWCCPTPGCSGAGFGFDIHPVDPGYIDPDGRDMGQWCFDDEDVECDEECTGEVETCCCDCCMMERGEFDDEFDEEREFAECGCGGDCDESFEIPLDDLLPQNDSLPDFEVTYEVMMEIEEKLGFLPPRDPPSDARTPPRPPINEDDIPF